MKQAKRLLCCLVLAVMLIGLLSGFAYADRNADAVSYLKRYLMDNGTETHMFDTHAYTFALPGVTDGDTTSTGPSVSYFENADALVASGLSTNSCVQITLDQAGKRSHVIYSNLLLEKQDDVDHSEVRADRIIDLDAGSGYSQQELADAATNVSVAFHRALLGLNEILKTGGFTLADLGFTNYTPYAGVCSKLADCPGRQFKDMPLGGNWAHDAIDWAVEQNITNGTSDTAFSPEKVCTRAQIVTFLWRAAGSEKPTGSANPFADVPADAYYRDAVLWALENHITTGTSDTAFSPNAVCTRAQVVTFLYRYAFRAVGVPAPGGYEHCFPDVPDDAYYRTPVIWALNAAITQGTSPTTFSPNAGCTRAQVVTFLYRARNLDVVS